MIYRSATKAGMRVAIDGFSGEYTMGEAAALMEELVKLTEFSKDNPSVKLTMRSNSFISGGVRTFKVCLSDPTSVDPPAKYILNKRRVRAMPTTSSGESEKCDNDEEEYIPEEGEAGPSSQVGKKIRT